MYFGISLPAQPAVISHQTLSKCCLRAHGHTRLLGSPVAAWPYLAEFGTISKLLLFSPIPCTCFLGCSSTQNTEPDFALSVEMSMGGLDKNVISRAPTRCPGKEILELKEQGEE